MEKQILRADVSLDSITQRSRVFLLYFPDCLICEFGSPSLPWEAGSPLQTSPSGTEQRKFGIREECMAMSDSLLLKPIETNKQVTVSVVPKWLRARDSFLRVLQQPLPCESQKLSPNYPQAGMLEGSGASRPLEFLVALPTWKGWGRGKSHLSFVLIAFSKCVPEAARTFPEYD